MRGTTDSHPVHAQSLSDSPGRQRTTPQANVSDQDNFAIPIYSPAAVNLVSPPLNPFPSGFAVLRLALRP